MAKLKSTINLQWIPGHSEVPGNEAADSRAKEAAKNNLNLERPPISLEAASTVIKRFFKDPQREHERTRQLSHSRDAEQLKSLLRSFHNELLSQVVVLLINPSQICHLQDLVHKLAILFEIAFFALTQQGLVILMSEELNAGSAELS